MGYLKIYLKCHMRLIMMLSMFSTIFIMLPFLYNVPAEIVYYAMILCLVLGSIFFAESFYNFCKRHEKLMNIKKHAQSMIEQLPSSRNQIEVDYNQIVTIIDRARRDDLSSADAKAREILEYFTLWVHQIKTPIAGMNLLLQTMEGEDAVELLAELFKIEEYVEIVLHYMRMENMCTDLVLKRQNLDSIIKQAIHKYAGSFIRKKISLHYECVDTWVLTDEKWLLFVIEQVLSNALKYTKRGSISIYMDEDKKYTLVIEDTGIGIQEEDLPRVFESGFTGYNGHMHKKSTGIGLYLCKKILSRLSHTIKIESVVGKGTKVFINLEMIERMIE